MKKCLKFLIFLFLCFPIYVYASNFDISGENVILYNLNDDTILYEINSQEQTNIASLTKIMTTLVAIDNIDDLNDYITITSQDFVGTNGYSKAGFQVGEKVTYLDLLYGILLPSGADAVNAIVNNTLGYDDFVLQMNALADTIGLENTSFSNPIGKDDVDNYSTAYDIAILLKYALKNEVFRSIFTTKEYTTTNGLNLESTLSPYKDFLEIDKIIGSKSGFTKGAGRCLASITTLNDVDYLLVVIKSSIEPIYSAVLDSLTIYDYYNENYSYQTILEKGDIIASIPIMWSKEKEYNIVVTENVIQYLENKTSENLEYVFDGVTQIEKGTEKGTKLGTIQVIHDNDVIYTSDVILNEDIEYYNPILWIIVIFLLITLIIRLLFRNKSLHKC